MKRGQVAALLAAALTAGSLSAAAPAFQLDDSGIDYVNGTSATSGQSSGYVALREGSDGLELVLSQDPVDGALPAIDLTVRDQGYDSDGDRRAADRDDLEGVELDSLGSAYKAFTVTHPDVSMLEAVEGWVGALERLGFTGTGRDYGRATTVLTFGGPDSGLRVVLHSVDDGVRAHVAQEA